MSINQVPWPRSLERIWSYMVAQRLTETLHVGWFWFLTCLYDVAERSKPAGRGLLSLSY